MKLNKWWVALPARAKIGRDWRWAAGADVMEPTLIDIAASDAPVGLTMPGRGPELVRTRRIHDNDLWAPIMYGAEHVSGLWLSSARWQIHVGVNEQIGFDPVLVDVVPIWGLPSAENNSPAHIERRWSERIDAARQRIERDVIAVDGMLWRRAGRPVFALHVEVGRYLKVEVVDGWPNPEGYVRATFADDQWADLCVFRDRIATRRSRIDRPEIEIPGEVRRRDDLVTVTQGIKAYITALMPRTGFGALPSMVLSSFEKIRAANNHFMVLDAIGSLAASLNIETSRPIQPIEVMDAKARHYRSPRPEEFLPDLVRLAAARRHAFWAQVAEPLPAEDLEAFAEMPAL